MTTLIDNLSQPFAAFRALAQAEEQEETRARLSTVSWFQDVWRVKASTIPRVIKPVSVITAWAVAVAVMDLIYQTDLGLTNNVVPLLSVVVGLLLVFRNSTAYQRWQEGRQLWSNQCNNVRNLARTTWISVGQSVYSAGRLDSSGKRVPWQTGEYGPAEKREKIAALRMMTGFVVASKHHVRQEYGTDYEDLKSLCPSGFLARFAKQGYGYGAADADYLASVPPLNTKISLSSFASGGTQPTSTIGEDAPLLAQEVYDDVVVVHKMQGRPSLPLPLVIAHRLQLYFAKCKAQGLLESVGPAGYNASTQAISALVNDFTAMERLLTLPLPTWRVCGHHRQTVTLYLMVLPLVLVDTLKWKMVPFVTLIAFTLMGIEGIASEIEAPFGHDASDLPLDFMCAELRNEIEQMIARLREVPEEGSLFT